ncbi:polysaccharide biosynthesis tyrosine autokinase [Verrucomicrobia bacterium]|nr:polysaccharide biosynthesis tyrosine autokinase [Verrucomicrobiota bacterium]
MEEDFENYSPSPAAKNKSKIKGVSDFLLIVRDRWLLSVALALPITLAYVFVQQQVPEHFRSSSSFSLTPPPAILSLQSVERENHLEGLIAKHTEGLNSQQLRANVILRLESNPEYKSILLGPYLKDGIRVGLPSTFSYTVAQAGTKSRPRFIISSDARSAKGAMIIADLAQAEYETLHRSTKSEKVEFVKQTLEDLLETSLMKERQIAKDMTNFKNKHGMPYIEDEKRDNGDRKSQFANELTGSSLEQIRIISLLRQIEGIKTGRGTSSDSLASEGLTEDIATIKEYFKIDAIEQFGRVPTLRLALKDLEKERKDFAETGSGYLKYHPKMLENERSIKQLKGALEAEVISAVGDLKDKLKQLIIDKNEFAIEMGKVQEKSKELSEIEEQLKNFDRQLAVVRKKSDQIQSRLGDVAIEQALPSDKEEPLRMDSFAQEPGGPYSPDRQKIKEQGIMIFAVLFILIPMCFEFIDNRVKSPWDVEVFIGNDLIGGIPKISEVEERERPLIVGNDLDDGLTESFRSMYSRIQMNSHADYPKLILVTSAIPSEGKSLISANLAYSCANHGRKTILVDFDLRRPGLHKFCKLENSKGLLTLVNDVAQKGNEVEDTISDVLTEIHPNLFVLPSGGKTRAATEMLEHDDFTVVIELLKRNAEVIIIDSPPIGLFPDSLAIARKVDEVLFVTRYGKVSRKVVKSLIESIHETGANLLGVVLNDLPQKKTPGYYYSGYYGYGYFRYKYYNKYYGKSDSEETTHKATASKSS